MIHPTAIIGEGAQLGEDVEIGPYCVVGPDVRLGDGVCLKSHVAIEGDTRLGRGCTVFPFASLGAQTQDLKFRGGKTRVEIGEGTTIREYVTVNAGTNEGEVTTVGSGCLIMAYAHIAHACRLGDGVIMVNCATLGGEVEVDDMATIGGLTAVHQFVRIGRMCFIGGCSRITKDCPPYMLVVGNPATVRGPNSVGLRRRQVSPESLRALKNAYRLLCREGLTTSQAVERIRTEVPAGAEISNLLDFIEQSKRGVLASARDVEND